MSRAVHDPERNHRERRGPTTSGRLALGLVVVLTLATLLVISTLVAGMR
jgi:hypothetical protein